MDEIKEADENEILTKSFMHKCHICDKEFDQYELEIHVSRDHNQNPTSLKWLSDHKRSPGMRFLIGMRFLTMFTSVFSTSIM